MDGNRYRKMNRFIECDDSKNSYGPGHLGCMFFIKTYWLIVIVLHHSSVNKQSEIVINKLYYTGLHNNIKP